MKLPDPVFAIVRELHARNTALAQGTDDDRRALQKKIVETVVARHPNQGWGWKSADPGRPPSKDAIANDRVQVPGHLVAWDCFSGGTREPVQADAVPIDGQNFIALLGVDHLAGLTPLVFTAPVPTPGHLAATLPGRDEFLAALAWINGVYREQLGRAGGVDMEGIAAHIFDTYLNARLGSASVEEAKGKVVQSINAILNRHDIHA